LAGTLRPKRAAAQALLRQDGLAINAVYYGKIPTLTPHDHVVPIRVFSGRERRERPPNLEFPICHLRSIRE